MISLSRLPSWCCCPRLCRSRVLTTVSGVAPRSCLPRLSASSWSYHKPAASSRLPQVVSTRIVQPRRGSIRWQTPTYCSTMFVLRAVVAEVLVHRRGALEQPHDVEPHDRRRQQAHGREHREPPAHAVGHFEHVADSRAPWPARTACRSCRSPACTNWPSSFAAAAPSDSLQLAEQNPKRRRRLQRAAALGDDDDAPPLVAACEQLGQRRAARRCRRCFPRSKSAAVRRARRGQLVVVRVAAAPRAAPGRPCTIRRCPAPPRCRPPRSADRPPLDLPDLALGAVRAILAQQAGRAAR